MNIANRATRLGSVRWVDDHADMREILLDRIENDTPDNFLREIATEALRVACQPLISDEAYRHLGQIATRMVEDVAIGVCNDYPHGTRTRFDTEEQLQEASE